MRYKYVFVGSGPSNLAAANLLLDRGVDNLLMLEQGNTFKRRGCPGLRPTRCTHCNGSLCHVTGGEGGSSALFGNKLCYFPASDAILAHFSQCEIAASFVYLDALLWPYFQSGLSDIGSCTHGTGLFTSPGEGGSARKDYASKVFSPDQFGQLIEKILLNPRRAGILRTNTEVVEIERLGKSGYRLQTAAGDVIESESVILGSGRSSHKFLRRIFSSLGIKWEENCQDVGLRLEARRELFSDSYTYQEDPKYKFSHLQYGTSRTFCACNVGVIVPVKFGESYYAEGAFSDKPSAWNNLALMVRSYNPISPKELEEWCATVNNSSHGSLLLGEVSLEKYNTAQLVAEIMDLVPQWPSDDHRFMMAQLLDIALGDRIELFRKQGRNRGPVRVYGPAVDLYWPKPELSKGLNTGIPGVYLLGDAAGISRGFVQAMVSGVAWALSHATDLSKSTLGMRKTEVGESCVSV